MSSGLKSLGMGGTRVVLVMGVATLGSEDWAPVAFAGGEVGGGGLPVLVFPGALATSGGGPLDVVAAGGGGLKLLRLPNMGISGVAWIAMTVGLGTAHAGGASSPFVLGGAAETRDWMPSPVSACEP